MFSERSGVVNIGLEGMMLMGAFLGIYGADKTGSWVAGVLIAMLAGGLLALVHAFFAIHLRADQIVGGVGGQLPRARHHRLLLRRALPRRERPGRHLADPATSNPRRASRTTRFLADAFGHLNLMIWVAFLLVLVSYVVIFKTPIGLRIRACGEHPRAADTVGINVYARPLRVRDPLGHARRDSAARTSRSASWARSTRT